MSGLAKGAFRGWAILRDVILHGSPSSADLLPGGAAPALTAPTMLTPPSISGDPYTGSTLTRTAGSYSGNPVPSVVSTWMRSGVSTGSTAPTYNLTALDDGETITVHEVATNSQGSATEDSNAIGPVQTLSAPSALSAPSISGGTVEGDTLTATPGNWSGNPAPTVTGSWWRGGVDTGTSGLSYTLTSADDGAMMMYKETATNSQGMASEGSNQLGPVTAPGGGGGTLAQPTVTNVSSPGTVPLVLSMSTTDSMPGLYVHWEFTNTLTPTYNADGSYSSPVTQWGITQVDADSYARLDLALGYNDPSGAFSFHLRTLEDDPAGTAIVDQFGQSATYDTSAWSANYADTISGSTAKLVNTTGTGKSRYLTVNSPYFTVLFNANVNALRAARSTTSFTGKKHFELHIDAGSTSTNGWAGIGFDDGTANLDATSGYPQTGVTVPGVMVFVKAGQTGVTIRRNGAAVAGGVSLPAAPAVGDVLSAEVDTATNTADFKWFRAADSSVTDLGSVTLTSQIPATWYGIIELGQLNDQGTANFGGSPFAVTPTAGYTGW